MSPNEAHKNFTAVVDGLRRAGGRLLRTSTGHPIGEEWQYWLVGSRVVALVVLEYSSAPGPFRQVADFEVMTGIGGNMDAGEIGKRLEACIERDRIALAESMGLQAPAGGAHLFDGQPSGSQDEGGSPPAPTGKRRNAARPASASAPRSALSST